MSFAATLREIIDSPEQFKLCADCGKICDQYRIFCECGSVHFTRRGVGIKKAAKNEISEIMRIYKYSRHDALETQIDV